MFLISETIIIILWLERTFDESVGQYFDEHVSEYNYLVMIFGFALSFEVYIESANEKYDCWVSSEDIQVRSMFFTGKITRYFTGTFSN